MCMDPSLTRPCVRAPSLAVVVAGLFAVLPVGADVAAASLTFERTDGTEIRFAGEPSVWCGEWEDEVSRRTVHVGLPDLPVTEVGHRFELRVVRHDITLGRALRFPNTFVWNRPRGASLFVADLPNEASTDTQGSSGSITFTRARCRKGGRVAFTIDAVVGSEFHDGEPITVSGTFRGRIRRSP